MSFQYITDSDGQTTGVFIPIKEWNELKNKFKDIDKEGIEIPEWHQAIVRKRMELYKSEPDKAIDFNTALDDIDKKL